MNIDLQTAMLHDILERQLLCKVASASCCTLFICRCKAGRLST